MRKVRLMDYKYIEVRPISGALGAEVRGIDVSHPPAPEVIAEIRQAWLEHLVIFLHEQRLAPHELVAFARAFGEPMEYPQLKGLAECPLVTPVVKLEHERV